MVTMTYRITDTVSVVSSRVRSIVSSAARMAAVQVETAHPTTVDATNRWLGGFDGHGCSGNPTAFGIKRIHPGRLGVVT